MAYTSNKNKKVNTQYIQNLADAYKKSIQTNDTVDIITFAEAKWGLRIPNLLPVQRFILKAYYGLELDGDEKTIILNDDINSRTIGRYTEKEFMQYLIDTGRTNITSYTPGTPKKRLILNAGRRASKSTLASIISNYETYKLVKLGNPQKRYNMLEGDMISVCVTAPSIENANTLFTTLKNHCLACNYMKDRIIGKSENAFTICTDHDYERGGEPTIKLVCGGAGSKDIRGRANIVVVMDEAAFFNASGSNSGDALYQALVPSVSSFTPKDEHNNKLGEGEGKIVLISSPMGKSGMFYNMYLDSFQNTDETLMFSMYTAMLNPTVDSGLLKDEKRRNPRGFNCEYGANFSDSVSTWIGEETLKKVIDENIPVNPRQGRFGIEYYMGIDYAGKKDGAAVSVVHRDGDKIVLDFADVYYAEPSDIWNEDRSQKYYDTVNTKFSLCDYVPLEEFAEEIKNICGRFPIKYGWFDQYNGYGLMEQLRKRGLEQFEMRQITSNLNQQMYQMTEDFIYSELITIPNHPILTSEITNMEKTMNGPRVIIEAPHRAGFHDDLTDSFVMACYACYDITTNKTHGNARAVGVYGNNCNVASLQYNRYLVNKRKMHGVQPGRGI